MNNYKQAERADLRRRRRERYLILFLFLIISFITYLWTKSIGLGPELPVSDSILIFALINLNVILLLLLLFLTIRNLVKLLFERRKNIMGAKIRTKLVLAFVILSLLPTVILFFISARFIQSSTEYWFNLQIEQSLENSLEVGQQYYERISHEILLFGTRLSRVISYQELIQKKGDKSLERFINDKRKEYGLASLKVYSKRLVLLTSSQDNRINLSGFGEPSGDILRKTLDEGTDNRNVLSAEHGDLIRVIVPIFSRSESRYVMGLLSLSRFVPGSVVNRLEGISMGLEEYRQLKMLKKPIKASHMITLSIVTLLIIFSSVWFGFYLSQGITVPIQELAEGTKRIASGDYDVFIDLETKDEIGILVNSFNRMASDLKESKNQLETANKELMRSNFEIEQRRHYMEIVLTNVAAGVISADAQGKIFTVNKSAERMLNLESANVIGRDYHESLPSDYVKIIEELVRDKNLFQKGFLRKQVRFPLENKSLTLLVSLNVLRDDHGNYLGLVGVFEDLTEMEKAQRAAAWREIARRIAHEVKNPLTPIQLSAQRLKKRYGEKLDREDGKVFQECTEMIIQQVEELKALVNEFSSFARMPGSTLAKADIKETIREAVSLYSEAHRDVSIIFRDSEDIPSLNLDKEQIKRAIINLLDNAIAAIEEGGEVIVALSYQKSSEKVRVEVADNGTGISPEHKARLFEPYFSTKKHGTGLGLAIVNTIVGEHNGDIWIEDNEPKGTRVIIELPVR